MIDELIFSLMRKKGYNCQSTFKENIFNPTSIIETANTVWVLQAIAWVNLQYNTMKVSPIIKKILIGRLLMSH